MSKNKFQKPFLKWVGGKSQIINDIIDKFPSSMNNYHEPFLGGGSVLFALLSLQKQKQIIIKGNIYAYDINKPLINLYKAIQNNKEELYNYIQHYINEYEEAKSLKESYYYQIRDKYNKMDKNEDNIECSALFLFINKTCFRGMYREGPKGYNVPYGHYKKTPCIITKKELDTISELIKSVNFIHSDFSESMDNIKDGDFVYLDPPYVPENKKSFVKYVSNGFGDDFHKQLFEKIKKIDSEMNIKFVMSNSGVDYVKESFKDYECEEITARRAINSKNPESTTTEVIIYN
jgi:DNA adenine methylase